MKKWMYLIPPVVMLGLFTIVYLGHVEKTHEKEKAKAAQIAKEKAELDEKKKVAEAKAREDAKKRTEERDAEEAKKEKDRADKQAADDKKVRDATAESNAKADAFAKQAASLEIELDRLRKEKDKQNRESFEIAKQVELARITRRNAELEIQRITEMISKRASDSSMTRPPVIPPAPAKQ